MNRPLPPTVVRIDNRTAIKTIHKRLLGQSVRHLRFALNILISAPDSKEVAFRWVDPQSIVADMYTAAEDSARLRRNLDVILGEAWLLSPHSVSSRDLRRSSSCDFQTEHDHP